MPAIPGVTSPMTYIGMWKVCCPSLAIFSTRAVTHYGNEDKQSDEALCLAYLQALQMSGSKAG